MQVDLGNVQYAGFWGRFMAMLLDTLVQSLILAPLVWFLVRADLQEANLADPFALAEQLSNSLSSPLSNALQFTMITAYCLIFWKFKSATPGKIMMGMSIVDAQTGGELSNGRMLLRYLGYYLCLLTCLLGFFWIGIDKRKQGLHDKLAGTVVVMNPASQAPGNP